MTAWLKNETPPKGPPMPPHIDVLSFMANTATAEQHGVAPPSALYIRDYGPRPAYDRWGAPLPLSPSEQARLDRITAILIEPIARGLALLHSGQLTPTEVAALKAVHPDIWADMVADTMADMVQAKPPFPAWVIATLSTLFEKPAAAVFMGEPIEEPRPNPRAGAMIRPEGTPADRRELAVRDR